MKTTLLWPEFNLMPTGLRSGARKSVQRFVVTTQDDVGLYLSQAMRAMQIVGWVHTGANFNGTLVSLKPL